MIGVDRLVAEAIRKWEEAVDLRTRITLGFEMVEKIATIQPSMARDLCRRVQNLLVQPGSELATDILVLPISIRSCWQSSPSQLKTFKMTVNKLARLKH